MSLRPQRSTPTDTLFPQRRLPERGVTLAEFFTYLRTDPKCCEKTLEALLVRYRGVTKRNDQERVKVYQTIPRLPYGVRAIPDNVTPDTTTAYYMPGAAD